MSSSVDESQVTHEISRPLAHSAADVVGETPARLQRPGTPTLEPSAPLTARSARSTVPPVLGGRSEGRGAGTRCPESGLGRRSGYQ